MHCPLDSPLWGHRTIAVGLCCGGSSETGWQQRCESAVHRCLCGLRLPLKYPEVFLSNSITQILLRLLPLLIGQYIPKGDETWEVLMTLKEVVELSVSISFTEESLCFLDSKISEHRDLFQKVFPGEKLRPKHHYIEHYPELIWTFGPLSHVWTMHLEWKHKFFKKAALSQLQKYTPYFSEQTSENDGLPLSCLIFF